MVNSATNHKTPISYLVVKVIVIFLYLHCLYVIYVIFHAAQVLFEKMREMLHFLPDPRPTLNVSMPCYGMLCYHYDGHFFISFVFLLFTSFHSILVIVVTTAAPTFL